jgi:hypothetical protein
MKSLQDKYILIEQGRGNKELFLKEARALFPNIVTNVLTFEQAIHNLTERGILTKYSKQPLKESQSTDWFKVFAEGVEDTKALLKDTDKKVLEKETAGYDYKEPKSPTNISPGQLLNGYYFELTKAGNETKTEEELKKIVFKNLQKDPLYYVKNGQFGVEGVGYTEDIPGLGTPKEVKGKFKASGMEPVKLNESKYKQWTNTLNQKFGKKKKVAEEISGEELENSMILNTDFGLGTLPKEKRKVVATVAKQLQQDKNWVEQNKTVTKDPNSLLRVIIRYLKDNIDPDLEKAVEKMQKSPSGAFLQDLKTRIGQKHGKKSIEEIETVFDPKASTGKTSDLKDKEDMEKTTLSEGTTKAIEKYLKEIEHLGEIASMEQKIAKIEEKIGEIQERLVVTESDGMKDIVDKKAVSQMKKDILFLERKKKLYEAKKAKLTKKSGAKKNTVTKKEEGYSEDYRATLTDNVLKALRPNG